MRKLIFAGALALAGTVCAASEADAGGRFRSRTRSVAVTRATADGPTTAQAKSETQAATGVMRHVGPVPSGHVEGVGFSTAGPAQALAACCYSGSGLPLVSEAVVRGRTGWFATRIFAASRTCSGPGCR